MLDESIIDHYKNKTDGLIYRIQREVGAEVMQQFYPALTDYGGIMLIGTAFRDGKPVTYVELATENNDRFYPQHWGVTN